MNEIERIERLLLIAEMAKNESLTPSLVEYATIEACEAGAEALREQAERENGCQYCTTGESLNGYDDVGSFAIHPNGKTRYLEVAYNDDFYNCAVYINFCPMCGKRLEVEHEN